MASQEPKSAAAWNTGGENSFFRNLLEFRFLRKKRTWIALVLLIFVYLFFNSMFVYINPNEYGIKVVKIGANRGVQKDVYTAGMHFLLPMGIHEMYRLPRDIQVLEMTNNPATSAQAARRIKAAHIQTSDGFFVDVDVSILYRIKDPHMVFTTIGPGYLFEDNGIIPKTEPALKDSLGELTTEEFYNSHLRVEKAVLALKKLNHELEDKGLFVEHLLIRYFRYSSEIQKNIEEKKLKDQLFFKYQAESRAADEAAKLKKVIQEGDANVKIKLAEGQAYVTKRRAEKDKYARSKRAEADLLIKLAEAKKTELRNEALQGQGSDRMVGLNMADAMKGMDVIILSSDGENGVNPLDLEGMLGLFGVRRKSDITDKPEIAKNPETTDMSNTSEINE